MNTSDKNTCANCGKEGSDVTNTCNKCKSVMYCNAACKKKHRHKHKKECERRVAELHDEQLFKQPPPKEDCPICFLQLPHIAVYMSCCGKYICRGCTYTVQSRATKEEEDICPFCRSPPESYDDDEEVIQRYRKRIELNDVNAIYNYGYFYANGENGLSQNMAKALEFWHRAGELGSAEAFCSIGNSYYNGDGVEADEKKATHYYELAAMLGDVVARHNLGCFEGNAGNVDRALKHFTIAVKDGSSESLESIKIMYTDGQVKKDIYADALQYYQEYVDEIESDQRAKAAAAEDE